MTRQCVKDHDHAWPRPSSECCTSEQGNPLTNRLNNVAGTCEQEYISNWQWTQYCVSEGACHYVSGCLSWHTFAHNGISQDKRVLRNVQNNVAQACALSCGQMTRHTCNKCMHIRAAHQRKHTRHARTEPCATCACRMARTMCVVHGLFAP